MTSPILNRTVEALELMAQAESTVERLYETCAAQWKEDKDFWQGLALEEKHHSEHIRSMISILTDNPGNFLPGRPFSAIALKTFISGIERDIESVMQFAMPELNALRLARDIEQALIEGRFTEVVQTEDKSFRALVDKIMLDTATHRWQVEKKIAQLQAKG
jgi:rubrerythrin